MVTRMSTLKVTVLGTVLAAVAAGCGSGTSRSTGGASTTTGGDPPTTVALGGTDGGATGTVTTSNGRYRIVLVVDKRGLAPTACAPPVAPGKRALRVTVTVTNDDAGRAVPFPPLRVELNAGGAPAPVPVRDSSGTCTFTPHEAAIGAGASVILPGATPPIDDTAPTGGAGRVEVSISETSFTLAVPVP